MEPSDPNHRPGPARRWLARLSFSFLIIAMFLAYTGYRGHQEHTLSEGRILLYYFCSMLAFVLFLMGTRERHRPGDGSDDGD